MRVKNPSEYWPDRDRTEREFTECGLQCCTRTHELGHRCGYVMIHEGHPLYGLGLMEVWDSPYAIDVDGGITFARGKDGCWIFGWDAAHAWHIQDLSIMDEGLREFYKTRPVVPAPFPTYMVDADMAEAETRRLARQLAEIGGGA